VVGCLILQFGLHS